MLIFLLFAALSAASRSILISFPPHEVNYQNSLDTLGIASLTEKVAIVQPQGPRSAQVEATQVGKKNPLIVVESLAGMAKSQVIQKTLDPFTDINKSQGTVHSIRVTQGDPRVFSDAESRSIVKSINTQTSKSTGTSHDLDCVGDILLEIKLSVSSEAMEYFSDACDRMFSLKRKIMPELGKFETFYRGKAAVPPQQIKNIVKRQSVKYYSGFSPASAILLTLSGLPKSDLNELNTELSTFQRTRLKTFSLLTPNRDKYFQSADTAIRPTDSFLARVGAHLDKNSAFNWNYRELVKLAVSNELYSWNIGAVIGELDAVYSGEIPGGFCHYSNYVLKCMENLTTFTLERFKADLTEDWYYMDLVIKLIYFKQSSLLWQLVGLSWLPHIELTSISARSEKVQKSFGKFINCQRVITSHLSKELDKVCFQ